MDTRFPFDAFILAMNRIGSHVGRVGLARIEIPVSDRDESESRSIESRDLQIEISFFASLSKARRGNPTVEQGIRRENRECSREADDHL